MQARCKVQVKAGFGGSGVVWCRPGARFKAGCEGSGAVWRRPGVRLVPGWFRRKVQGRGSGVVWCRPGVRFKEGSGGSRAQARCKVQGRFRRFRGGAGQV